MWHTEAGPDSAKISVGANIPYGAIQNFGGDAGRNHATHIPARPFMLLQDDDIVEIVKTVKDYIVGGE